MPNEKPFLQNFEFKLYTRAQEKKTINQSLSERKSLINTESMRENLGIKKNETENIYISHHIVLKRTQLKSIKFHAQIQNGLI